MQTPYSSIFEIFSELEKMFVPIATAKGSSYPPYNILKISPERYSVEVACAGFPQENLSVDQDGGELVIKGAAPDDTTSFTPKVPADSSMGEFPFTMHRGLAKRAFNFRIKMPETTIVDVVTLKNGLLTVILVVGERTVMNHAINDPAKTEVKRQHLNEDDVKQAAKPKRRPF